MTKLIEKREKKTVLFPRVISKTQASNQTACDRDLSDDTNDAKYECNENEKSWKLKLIAKLSFSVHVEGMGEY